MYTDPYAPPKATTEDVVSYNQAPPLWNPNAAASWSVLLSPAFGAFLHMKNWQALGDEEKAAASRNWVIAYVGFILLIVTINMMGSSTNMALPDSLSRSVGLGLLFGWYFASGKGQAKFINSEFGSSYPRKGWLVPILSAIGTWVAVVFVIGLVATY